LDRPFNQLPSLHITICMILAQLYLARVKRIFRAMLCIWFALIAISTVLTYQHHVIDVVGGAALAVLCFHLWQDTPLRLPVTCNRRVGLYYAVGVVLLAGAGIITRPLGYLLLWPATSLGLVAAAYFGLGPGIFRKRLGRLPLTTWLLLWPVLLGQRLSLAWYARQCRPWDVLTDGLWIGRKLADAEAAQAVAQGVTAVLDLTGESSETRPFLAVVYRQLPVLDLTAPTPSQLNEAVDFICTESARGVVYVHCKVGYSRTAAVAGAYLLASGAVKTVEEVAAKLRAARPGIIIRPEAMQALRMYHSHPSARGIHRRAAQIAEGCK
jgi:hypothetical protein